MCPILCCSLILLTAVPAAQQATDEAPALLRQRSERHVQDPPGIPGPSALGSVHPDNRLFFMVGGDNAECVRAVPDVEGDGRDEILVGIGQSGTDNVFCLSGASSGAASVLWSIQTDGGVSGGSCYGDQSIVPVSDTEGDGHANVLLGTAWGGRTAYDFDTLAGAELWRFDTYLESESGWIYSLCEVSDVTGDGVPEYAFGSGSFNDRVYLVDGASSGQAAVRWSYHAGDAVYSVRNIGDVNGDGTDDVLAAIGDDVDRVVCLEGDTTLPGGRVLWSHVPGVGVYACGVLSDVTGDGVDEALAVLWTLGGGAIRCLDGTSGALLWSSTAVAEYGMMVDELADVTGDGIDEVIVSSWENAVRSCRLTCRRSWCTCRSFRSVACQQRLGDFERELLHDRIGAGGIRRARRCGLRQDQEEEGGERHGRACYRRRAGNAVEHGGPGDLLRARALPEHSSGPGAADRWPGGES
jgi:hypothetical protein